MPKTKKVKKTVKKTIKTKKIAKPKKVSNNTTSTPITKPTKEKKVPAPVSELPTIQVPVLKVPGENVPDTSTPSIDVPSNIGEPTPPSAEALASVPGEEPKPKKVKKVKVIAKTAFHFDLPLTGWARSQVDDGWRNYRVWTNYELDWDDKDDDAGKMASIKKCMGKSKTGLVKALETMSDDSLVVKTDLKLDEFPFEPFIEVWISREKEAELVAKLIALPIISTIDPDYDGNVKSVERAIAVETPVKIKKVKKAKKTEQVEATT
jgi:hypothetical protein